MISITNISNFNESFYTTFKRANTTKVTNEAFYFKIKLKNTNIKRSYN